MNFAIGRIADNQVADDANRKGWDLRTADRGLALILKCDPFAAVVA